MFPKVNESVKLPNKKEVPSLVKLINAVIPLLISSKKALPAGTFKTSNAKISCNPNPIPTNLQLIFFLFSDNKNA